MLEWDLKVKVKKKKKFGPKFTKKVDPKLIYPYL